MFLSPVLFHIFWPMRPKKQPTPTQTIAETERFRIETLSAPEPDHEHEKVSLDWIREQLQKGFCILMDAVPQGAEDTLISDYLFRGQWHSLRAERTPLKLMRDFATAVFNLQTVRESSTDEIHAFLKQDVAQAVLMEEVWWVQKYLD